jgi:hypothetical protein
MSGSPKRYNATVKGVMKWAEHELRHVGYIAAVADPDIQYSYAMSTVNGMLHLRDALFELVSDPAYADKKTDLLRLHDQVVRVIRHLIREYSVSLDEIKAFNTHHVLGNLAYLQEGGYNNRRNRTRRNNNVTKRNVLTKSLVRAWPMRS